MELTGDERLGLRVGAAQHVTAWGLLGFALLAADTLRHAIETGVKYQNISGAMTVWSTGVDEDGAFVLRAPTSPIPPSTRAWAPSSSRRGSPPWSPCADWPSASDFAPRVVEFSAPPPRQRDLYGAVFGLPGPFPRPGRHGIVIDLLAWARAPMPGRDPVTHASTLETLDAQLASRTGQQDLLEVLEVSVAQSLPVIPSFGEQASTARDQRADAAPPAGRLRYHLRGTGRRRTPGT
ncbi:AraC family transcriptional regulator ligand-binding domain-containing protein [Streptomyces sp. L7]